VNPAVDDNYDFASYRCDELGARSESVTRDLPSARRCSPNWPTVERDRRREARLDITWVNAPPSQTADDGDVA